jgi:hypothetical protein
MWCPDTSDFFHRSHPNEQMQAAEPSQMDGSLARYQILELYLRTIISQILPTYIPEGCYCNVALYTLALRKFRKG